jgi:hypothetical protein
MNYKTTKTAKMKQSQNNQSINQSITTNYHTFGATNVTAQIDDDIAFQSHSTSAPCARAS